MKRFFTMIVLLVTGITLQSKAQTIRRVNATLGLTDPAIYQTVQAAVDAAISGDIIYVEPFGDDGGLYDSEFGVTITKQLTIIGPGYDLTLVPNSSFDKRRPVIGSLTFERGSAGSTVIGATIGGGNITIRDTNVKVTRCTVHYITLGLSSIISGGTQSFGNNATITNCAIGYVIGTNATNCVISNNIFTVATINSVQSLVGAVINNNTFRFANTPLMHEVDGSTITNNIFDGRGLGSVSPIMAVNSVGNTISNNLCTDVEGLPSGAGNVNNANPNLVFAVANPWAVNPFSEANLQLATNSPAKTVGAGGTPIGAFAGNNPYVLSGIPNVPVITTLINTGAGTTTTPINVTISVRSAN